MAHTVYLRNDLLSREDQWYLCIGKLVHRIGPHSSLLEQHAAGLWHKYRLCTCSRPYKVDEVSVSEGNSRRKFISESTTVAKAFYLAHPLVRMSSIFAGSRNPTDAAASAP